jgi:Phage P22-like portal protein
MAKYDPKKSSLLEASITSDLEDSDKDLLKLARRRFIEAQENWEEIRREAVEDQKFYGGVQYDEQIARAARAKGGAPQIQINQLKNFVQQVENNIRQQNISLTVHATDEEGSEENAEILQGIIRHIEHISNAKQAYLWAAGSCGMLVPGFGFIKLETDYTGPMTFDQEIYIRGVKDPMKILPDFMADQPDFSDAEFWFEFEEMSKDEYKEKYSNSKLSEPKYGDWGNVGIALGSYWMSVNAVTVAKYWYKDTEIRHFAAFSDGTTGFLDDFGVEINDKGEQEVVDKEKYEKFPSEETSDEYRSEYLRAEFDKHVATGSPPDEFPITEEMVPQSKLLNVVRTREVVTHKICWVVTNGVEILDRGEWHDTEFPFVAMVGKDEIIDGKRKIHGIVRDAKDPQKMYNFLASQIIRKIDASNKSAWIAAQESIPEPQRKRWELSNIESPAVLYYKSKDEQGQPIPPPQRGDAVEPAIQMLMAAGQQFNQDIKSTVGIYEAGMGQGIGDRQSGAAIQTLAQNGEMNNFHFSDNLVMSMKRLGCLILRLIPKIYDTPRTVRIIGLDDESTLVRVNQLFNQNGVAKKYDLTTEAEYDVVVDTGPSFASRKAEQSESMIKFGAVEPQIMPIIADLIASNMDWDQSGAIKERIQQWQTAQFPWIHYDDNMNLPPQAKVALQTANAHIATLQQAVTHSQQMYAAEKFKNDTNAIAHASKERVEQIKSITSLQLKRMDLIQQALADKDKYQIEHLRLQLEHIQHHQNLLLKGIQAQDKAANNVQPELYNDLESIINQPLIPQNIQQNLNQTSPGSAPVGGPTIPSQ